MADTLTYPPSTATQLRRIPRVLRTRFGDGYAQEMADGINADLQAWEIVYDPVHANVASGAQGSLAVIDAFFTAQAGYKKFFWTPPPPYDVQRSYVCLEWTVQYDRGLQVGLHATLEQRP
jgi:phage-related protein